MADLGTEIEGGELLLIIVAIGVIGYLIWNCIQQGFQSCFNFTLPTIPSYTPPSGSDIGNCILNVLSLGTLGNSCVGDSGGDSSPGQDDSGGGGSAF
jgi:hypothetical protein